MKKNTIAAIAAALLCLCLASGTFAQGAGNVQIPSSASDDYQDGAGWQCRLLAYSAGISRALDWDCRSPANVRYVGLSQVFANPGCPGGAPQYLYPASGAPLTVWITSYSPTALGVTINGAPVTLTRHPNGVSSPAPYSGCGAAPALVRACPWFAPGC